ncbi:HipA domain-containing protein [Flavisolibacter ginsengisoli]|uniref:Serine/threonine-protein kinase HipA n=1 Tax=Flavisolibacter ginsengisoli DSM 18119 TaxID=1121884 RepID=A0A1M5E3P4_9BACT|nr:HipA domain-containing protein [Flavisolibacter ginsengisoli]SHF73816.1 serine/threonine-protein kinase HipA [Flavisolibacter ginsengisoli DSM 18119]
MRCLYCYNELENGLVDFHPDCSRKIFGTRVPPRLPYDEKQMLELGKQVIKSHVAVTGVQPKLSLDIEKTGRHIGKMEPKRFTIVGLWGGYILKPPTSAYPQLPQLEDLTMHLAALSGIATVPHSLIRMQSGILAYITKRIDRVRSEKIHMEDMCQLTERLTENKYKGSYEQIAKAIIKYSINPGLDMIDFFEQVVFSFLTGNADMHLKNFSLIKRPGIGYMLSPAYDMIPSSLVTEGDNEELALNLNGKKRKLQKKDFDAFVIAVKLLEERSVENIYNKFRTTIPRWFDFIPVSFIDKDLQGQYISLIKERADVLGLM